MMRGMFNYAATAGVAAGCCRRLMRCHGDSVDSAAAQEVTVSAMNVLTSVRGLASFLRRDSLGSARK